VLFSSTFHSRYLTKKKMSEQPVDALSPAERAAKEAQDKLEKQKEQEEQAQLPYT
jgi:hypothetical protein